MVFRPYNFYGVLLGPISETAKVAVVDPALAILVAQASVDNWCYLRIGYKGKYEIVKVIHAKEGLLHICRGRDNTDPLAFPSGAVIEYILTASEIIDSVLPAQPVLYGYGAIQVVGYEIQYVTPKVEFVGVNYLIGENSSEIVIGRLENAYGCCNGNNAPAPIGGQYFVLTTSQYPVEHSEALDSYAIPLESMFLAITTLDISNSANVVGGTCKVALKTTAVESELVEHSAAIMDGLLEAGYHLVSMAPENVAVAGVVLSGILDVALVHHIQPAEEFTHAASLVSGTLI